MGPSNRLRALRNLFKLRSVLVALALGACTSGDHAAGGLERARATSQKLGTSPGTYGEQGPGPITEGATSANPPNIGGATEVVVAHPTNADVIYIGTTNGGVWQTTNATSASPHWVPLTDFLPSLSIRALAMDPTNPQVLIAGTGACSNFFGASGFEGLIYLTQDGGNTWTVINSPVAQGQRITGVAIRGGLALASTGFGQGSAGRILRSTDGGNTWAILNGTGSLPASLGSVFDLAADPSNASRYYAAVGVNGLYRTDDSGVTWHEVAANDPAPNPRPLGQITFTLQEALQNADNARLSVAPNGRLYVATSANGKNVYVGFTDNQGGNWTDMDIPRYPTGSSASPVAPAAIANASNTTPIVITTTVNHGLFPPGNILAGRSLIRVRIAGVQGNTAANGDWAVLQAPPATAGGSPPLNQFILVDRLSVISPPTTITNSVGNGAAVPNTGTWQQWIDVNPVGMAGFVNLAIVADPTNPNLAYVSGDAGIGFANGPGFSNVARALTTVAATGAIPSPQWANEMDATIPQIPGGGTANNTAPHADSRSMTFAANGWLLETCDGGIFRRTSPRDNTGDWFSLDTDLENIEIHDVAYDSFSSIVIGGAQDNGTPFQNDPGEQAWEEGMRGGDGGDVRVDVTSTPGVSVRYSSAEFLEGFTRWTFDANNVQQSSTPIPLVIAGQAPTTLPQVDPLQFVTHIDLDKADPTRMVIAGSLAVYESFDDGATVTSLGAAPSANNLSYGHPSNADVLWVATNTGVFLRPNAGAALAPTTPAFPGGSAIAITVSGPDPTIAYVAASSGVFVTSAPGGTRIWTNITGDLSQQNEGNLHAISYIPNATGDRIAVAADRGVFMMSIANPGVWTRIGTNLPNALIFGLDYNAAQDVLVAGTLGRGAWIIHAASTLTQAPKALCQNVTVPANSSCQGVVTAAQVNAGSSDPDGNPITLSLSPAGPFGLGTTDVTLTVADNLGTSATCAASVTVVDTTPPAFGPISTLDDRACAPAEVALAIPTPSVTDICPIPVTVTGTIIASSNPAVSVPVPITGGEATLGVGTYTIQWVAVDAAGNKSETTQTLVVGAGIQSTSSFELSDRAIVRTASGTPAGVVNSGTGTLSIGNDSHVGDLLAVGPVVLYDRSVVGGSIVSDSTVMAGNQDTIAGKVFQHQTVAPPPPFSISVTFPTANNGNVDLEPGQDGSIAPGAYNQVRIASRATLTLSSVGDYLMNSLDVEPQANVEFNSAGGTVRILVKNSLTYENAFVDAANVGATLGYFGSAPGSLLAPFTGTLVAPNATMTLGTDGTITYTGEFFAKSFDIVPGTTLVCR